MRESGGVKCIFLIGCAALFNGITGHISPRLHLSDMTTRMFDKSTMYSDNSQRNLRNVALLSLQRSFVPLRKRGCLDTLTQTLIPLGIFNFFFRATSALLSCFAVILAATSLATHTPNSPNASVVPSLLTNRQWEEDLGLYEPSCI